METGHPSTRVVETGLKCFVVGYTFSGILGSLEFTGLGHGLVRLMASSPLLHTFQSGTVFWGGHGNQGNLLDVPLIQE